MTPFLFGDRHPSRRARPWLMAGLLSAGYIFAPAGYAQINGLDTVQQLSTVGITDFEPFTIDGVHYLAAANSYDGTTREIDSVIYRWDGSQYLPHQSIPTIGAYDWEYFTIGGTPYLALANHYDGTTFEQNSVIYRWNGTEFVEQQTIPTTGAIHWESFVIDGEHYLALANLYGAASYSTQSKIFHWDGTQFSEVQSIPATGAYRWHHFTIDTDHYLAVANFRDDTTGYETDSVIYRWNGTEFSPFQSFATRGASDWESFTIDGEHYLALANRMDGTTNQPDSSIYRWNGTDFEPFQTIATEGAIDWEFFTLDGAAHLALASYLNDTSFSTTSVIYAWDGTQFSAAQSTPSQGAIDWEVFTIDDAPYMALANHYDGGSHSIQSSVFRIDAPLLPIARLSANPTEGTAPLTVTLDASTATDPDGGAIVDYQWSSSDAQSATGSTASFTFDVAGSYSVTLTVTDDEGETAQQTIDIQVDAAVAGGNCEGRASYSAVDGRLHLPLMDIATVPLIGASGRPAGDSTVPTTATLRIIPGTTLFEIESVVSATPDPAAVDVCHADYSIDGVLTVPLVDVPVVTSIGGVTVTTSVDTFGATLELLPMSDLFTLTEIRQLP